MAADWYCRIAGAELGPLSSQQLRALADDGRLRADDEVCQGREGKWVQASRVKGLLKGSGGEVLVAQPLTEEKEPAAQKPAAVAKQRAGDGPLRKAQAAPRPPKAPKAAVPVAKAAAAASPAPVAASPFVFREPDAERGKASGGKSAALSPAEVAKRRQKQRTRLLFGSLGALVAIAAVGVVLWAVDPFSAPGEANTASKPKPAEEPLEEDELGDLELEPDDLLGGTANTTPTSSEPEAADGWVDASEDSATAGPVEVRVVSAEVGKPKIHRGDGRYATPTEEYLIVELELTNTDPAKKLVHKGWGGRSGAVAGVALVDNHGNPYKPKAFSGGTIEGQQSEASLYPDEPLSDVLVFERPVPAASYLRLTLPASVFGQTGSLRFQIPKPMIGAESGDQVAEGPRAPQAQDERPEPPKTDGQVYELEATEKAVEQAIGMEPEGELSDFERFKRENPSLFPES